MNNITQLGSGQLYDATTLPDVCDLETFDSPSDDIMIKFDCPEFTSMCLHGDTYIDVATNELEHPKGIMIKDLVGKNGFVFSFDCKKGKPVVKQFKDVRKTRENADLIKIQYVLRKGCISNRKKVIKEIVCTPDHLILVKKGYKKFEWKEATYIKPGDRFISDQRSNDYIRDYPRHVLIMECVLGKEIKKSNLVVHHIDHNHYNNNPENLMLMDNVNHISYHQTERYGYDLILDPFVLAEEYNKGASLCDLAKKYNCDVSTIDSRLSGLVDKRTQRESLLLKNRTETTIKKYQECLGYYERGYSIDELAEYYGVHSTTIMQWIQKAGGTTRKSWESQLLRKELNLPSLNHRVVSVSYYGKGDVYNMEVEDTECFFANDIVVHNCPVTGQPDFGSITIEYVPNQKCVETKSLKIYLQRHRNFKGFMEQIVTQIREHLVTVLDPNMLRVVGKFNPRGGISPTIEALYIRDGYHLSDELNEE